MPRYALILLVLFGLTSAAIFFVANRPAEGVAPVRTVTPVKLAPAELPTFTAPVRAPEAVAEPVEPSGSVADEKRKRDDSVPYAAERKRLRTLANSHDPANVPALALYLHHADAALRAEATLGLVVLGDPSAVPFLEAALKKAVTPLEGVGLQDAIDTLNQSAAEAKPVP